MHVKVKYFARLREIMGTSEEDVQIEHGTRVHVLWEQLSTGKAVPEAIKTAVNLEYVSTDTILAEGDEIAFFPPVTGG